MLPLIMEGLYICHCGANVGSSDFVISRFIFLCSSRYLYWRADPRKCYEYYCSVNIMLALNSADLLFLVAS